MQTLRISEHFYSIQGEGASVGTPAIFVRLQGCNLLCGRNGATWTCDTIDVWKKGQAYSIKEWHELFLSQYKGALDVGAHIIITGGEPLLQQQALTQWVQLLDAELKIEVETNGTICPNQELMDRVYQWNVSPKLDNSGEEKTKRVKKEALEFFASCSKTCFKFVISSDGDIQKIYADYPEVKDVPMERKYLMPAADNQIQLKELYPKIIEISKKYGFVLGQRFHIEIWNQKTGI